MQRRSDLPPCYLYVGTNTSAIVKCVAGSWPELVEANSDGATSNATAFVGPKMSSM